MNKICKANKLYNIKMNSLILKLINIWDALSDS